MNKYYYHKGDGRNKKKITRIAGIGILLTGLIITVYIFFPFISWQIYFAPAFAYSLNAPIPKPEVVNPSIVDSIVSQAGTIISGVDYTDARNWFPYAPENNNKPKVSFFTVSIPKLKIQNAKASAVDTDLSNSLVNYPGTAIPGDKGTSVIYGHSTLPQLFDPTNYKTIFATLYKLKVDDVIYANVENVQYKYKIFDIFVVEADNTSIFTQDLNDSYITLVTCTPPGTTWKRLIIKAKLERI